MLIVVKHVDVFIFEIESHATKNQFYYCFNFNTLTLPDFAYRMFDIDSDFSLGLSPLTSVKQYLLKISRETILILDCLGRSKC
jgi:hypothetical protein